MNALKKISLTIFSIAAVALVLSAASTKVAANPEFMPKAKSLGFPANNCQYCHKSPAGGKGWNDRGNFLIAEKGKRKAKTVDVAWLKDYKGK